MSVLVVGSINADIFMEVQRMPLLGETLAASGSRLLIGGKGANQAVAAALSGGISTSFMGQLGDDHATKMKMHLTQAGVTLDPASQVHSAVVSGQAMIFLLASSGDNAIVIVPGANAVWPTALTPAMQESIRHASVVMLQCEIPAYVNHMVAVEAKSAGVTVIWDVGGEDRPLDDGFLAYVDFVCPNETELQRLSRATQPLETLEALVELKPHGIIILEIVMAAKALQARMHPLTSFGVLVTRGPSGAVLIDKYGRVRTQPSFPADNVRDTTGAGDCFRGSFAAMLAKGEPIEACLKFAAASSALCVGMLGATMPSFNATMAFLSARHSSM